MGWTWKYSRRQTRRRTRPLLEHLDDRCLLSTTSGLIATDHVVTHVQVHRHVMAREAHEKSAHAVVTHGMNGHHVNHLKDVERPAGSLITGATTAYDPIIGAAATRTAYQVDGSGMTVAVIDTGVDYNNPALGGGFGPGNKVIAGFDFADNTGNPLATSSQHGTAIAGLISSSDPSDLGVAPGADIVALRVTDSSNTASLGSIANALQWVITNHAQYNISSVNMSLSDGGNYAQNWFAQDGGEGQQITQLIGQLTALNIPVIAATGNSFTGAQGEGFAAIVQGTISVTATDLNGNLLSNAQRLGSAIGGASATTIAAPGAQLTAPSGDAGTSTVEGTSFATALVTGGVTLLQEIYESRFGTLPTVAQIKSWLQAGSTPIYDSVTGITLGELNLQASAALIPQAQAPAAPPTSASPPITVVTAPTATQTPITSTIATSTTSNGANPATSAPATITATTSTTTSTATTSGSSASTATTVASTATAASNVQVYVNGHKVEANSSSTSAVGSLGESAYEELLQAMSAWASNSPSTGSDAATQVQVWNA